MFLRPTPCSAPFARLIAAAAAAAALTITPAQAISLDDTRLLQQPAVSDDHVAFVYAGDLWIADLPTGGAADGVLDAGKARRLTSHAGLESNPRFSPDGRSIAFSAEYDGNRDVYLVPVTGGVAARLTWHP
ncbi:MAG: hypothetical protein AAFX50_13060, partial [Acidobacteriota bacterium]